jgi:DNA-binding response OmpR family regulator
MKSVLIVEDNQAMLRGLQDNFAMKGYRVKTAPDGERGLRAALKGKPDLVILDIMLPKLNGYDICSQIRREKLDMPIIMLTAKDREDDVVLGLNVGADDYITKPFSVKELLARADAFMRRRPRESDIYEFGDCRLDTVTETLTCAGWEVRLSPGQYNMLHLFLRRAGCALTCDEICGAVWGYSHFVTRRDIHETVARLREIIEPDPADPTFIRTVPNIGYRFELFVARASRP